MKKDFLTLAKSRKTVYDFTDKPVLAGALGKLLEAGRSAPSFKNSQPWEFVVVRNKETIAAMMQCARYGLYRAKGHANPPLAIALVLKKKYWEGEFGYPSREKPGIFEAYLSMAMPALSMMLQAEELGISSNLLSVEEHEVKRLLKVGQDDLVPLIIGFGYARKGAAMKKRSRKPLGKIVSYEFSRRD